jgi:Tol biopolymer transport system component
MFTKFVFATSQTLLIIFLIISGCKNSPTDGDKPLCLDCPIDFRLTDFEPAWSPDGHTIAYVHGDTVNGQTGIWLIDTNGVNKHVIYASASAYSPTWSPDGQWIAFSDQAQIFKMKLNGVSLTQLTVAGHNFFPAWSPDGQWIVYDRSLADGSGPAGIWIMKSDGMQIKAIFNASFPDWHPNGNIVIGVIGTSPTSIWTRFVRYSLSLSGTIDTLLAVVGNYNSYPKYSPDGTKIAFASQPNGGKTQIWIVNSDGSNLYQLTLTQGYSCDWSPNGEWIVYTDSRAVSGRLWLIRSDGRDNHQLTF